jgi:hypothetical protein
VLRGRQCPHDLDPMGGIAAGRCARGNAIEEVPAFDSQRLDHVYARDVYVALT